MSFFEDASLVLIPSAYKDQKVYSVKPTDGTGDLTFSRASSATRVQSDGLIEKVRTNIILQSEDFTTTWAANVSPTITANTTVAPDGTTTGDTIAASGSGSGAYQVPTVANGVEHSFSVYIKNITSATNVAVGCDLNPTTATINFNAVTGAIVSTGAGITGSSVTNAGNGWYRVSGTYVSTGTSNTFVVFGASAMTFAAWGAQLETGVTTDYIATTTAAVSVGPVSGLPRLDYLGSTCPRLLLEPQRTNLALNNISYIGLTSGGEGAFVTGPDGYLTGRRPIPNSGVSRFEFLFAGGTFSTGAVVTYSWFVKVVGTPAIPSPATGQLDFDVPINNTPATPYKVADYANGWERWAVACTIIDGAVQTRIRGYYGNIIGVGNDAIAYHGHQIEVGTYPTSVIYTLSTSVTRVADAASKTGISSLIGQTEGAFMIDVNLDTRVSFTYFALAPNITLTSNYLGIGLNATTIIFESVESAALQAQIVLNNSSTGRFKIAAAYKANDFVMYVNGTQVGTDTSGSVPTCSQVGLYQYNQNQSLKYNQALLFKTRLTNAQLAELTA
jgi:hypothetical protein